MSKTDLRGYWIYLSAGNVRFVTETCCNCGVLFAITEEIERCRRADQRDFYCPNGHRQRYVESTETKLRNELAAKEERLQRLRIERDTIAEERDHQAAVARGYKGQMVRTQKRISKGVCPCCNRSFTNVGRHMASQHPDYGSPVQEA